MKKISKTIMVLVFILIIAIIFSNKIYAATTSTDKAMSISYNTHIQYQGWESDYSKSNGQTSGTSGKSLRLEAIKIKLNNAPAGITLKYQVHVQNEGWQTWKSGGQTAGTSGKGYRLEAIKIKLEGTKGYKVQYRVHVQNIGWQEWKEDGDIAGTSGQSLRLEAIQIRIVKVDTPTVEYNSHVAMNGWETSYSRSNGQVSGTTGKDLGMQAIKIKLSGVPTNANIQYQTHVQYQGWKNWTSEGNVGGTTGLGLNIEAIKIKINNLEGKSIQYRVHIQNIGWQEWKTDGQTAGTTGRGLRIEAIQIKIVDKTEKTTQKGIDVSSFQGKIDWQKVKKDGVEFTMIRAGYRGYGTSSDGINGKLMTDDYYISNINGAINAGIDTGVYFFTQAINEKEAIEEANYVLKLVKDYKITYPIAIDTEYSTHPSHQGRADNLTVTQRTNVVKAFCDTIEKAGYESMIYASKSWFNEKLDMSKLSNYPIWLAHYTGATQDNPLAKPSDYEGKYIMWQYTSQGVVNGILKDVDMNVGYKTKSATKETQIIY